MKNHATTCRNLLSILLASLLCAGCNPALAAEVEVGEVAPSVETVGLSSGDFAMPSARDGLTMLFSPPPVPRDATFASAPPPASPLTLRAASGSDTRLSVDIGAADKATDGWPWYGKVAFVAGCVVLVGLTAWAVIEASNGDGSHDNDSSQNIMVRGYEGATVNVRVDSPDTSTRSGW